MSNYDVFEPLPESIKEKQDIERFNFQENVLKIKKTIQEYNLKTLQSDYLSMNTYYLDTKGNILYSCAHTNSLVSRAPSDEADHIRSINK